ncbi:MAG: rod shape-determining protein [Peptococcaceae bacterium]|nr:rod shape-determining protein [Peptococcaceae bacterium]
MTQPLNEKDVIFALDIGTRTVIGIVGVVEQNRFRILAQEMLEHGVRAMQDGQIHDIPKVATLVSQIKAALEEKVGIELKYAAIAAAGRSLRTVRSRGEMEVEEYAEIDQPMIRALELEALRRAYEDLDEHRLAEQFFYVGHSVIAFELDGYPLANLQGHRGKVISTEIVATFLPASVINGLLAVLQRVGLQPLNLTLEPIAAVEVAVPERMRLLNLALVDIGAGTSDIAITRGGSVVAFGMVPVAGDEITEIIMSDYVVDFDTAEWMKRQLVHRKEIRYRDIIGVENVVGYEEIMRAIDPVLNRLADDIVDRILVLNNEEAPKSVLCVGGGAQIPKLTEKIAERLQLEPHRVAVRGRDALDHFVPPEEDELSGPQGVTVVGIAVAALRKMGFVLINVKVNGREYRVFNSKGVKVSDALSVSDIEPRDLFARNGHDLKFTLNGQQQVLYGGLSRPAQILVNGTPASLQTPVHDGDEITVIKAENGKDAAATVGDLMASYFIYAYLDGRRVELPPTAAVNDLPAAPDTPVRNGDRVTIKSARVTVKDLARQEELDLNGRTVWVNERQADPDYVINNGDRIELHRDDEVKTLPGAAAGDKAGVCVTVNGETVILQEKEPIFLDVFKCVNLDLKEGNGTPTLILNGAEAAFTDPLKEGDRIEIIWPEGGRKLLSGE